LLHRIGDGAISAPGSAADAIPLHFPKGSVEAHFNGGQTASGAVAGNCHTMPPLVFTRLILFRLFQQQTLR
jgi:hypothetical protein